MLTTFNITQRGESHISSGTECQDYSASVVTKLRNKQPLSISVIADGVGNCQCSQYGAEIAVKTTIGYIKKRLERAYRKGEASMTALIRSSFDMALKRIHACADSMEIPFPLFDTTLTIVVYDGDRAWYGHIGDSGFVALFKNGEYALITQRHQGEEANSAFPLPCKSKWDFGMVDNVASFVLMTDGVLDFCVGNQKLENRVFFPFLKPALAEAITRKALCFARQDWSDFFTGRDNREKSFRNVVIDDISFVVVQNVEAVKSLAPIYFDLAAWNRRTQEFLVEQRRVLNRDYEKWKNNQETPPDVAAPNQGGARA